MSNDRHEHWQIGAWQVRPESGDIVRDGVVKKLDPRTMRLLMFLAERPGEIVKLSDLLDGVWGKAVVTQHSVYEAVAGLRQALGDAAEHPEYIATLPRRGYRLIADVEPPSVPVERDVGDAPSAVVAASWDPLITVIVPRTRLTPMAWLGVALTAMVLVALFARTPPASNEQAPVEKSIAVLPFVDFSEKKDQEYLADGLAEELLDVLANLPGLRVIARTSSFQFKNRNDDVRYIGTQLGVAYVVEGSIRRSGDRVRVAAQLIRTSDGSHQWSGTFDHDVGDTLQLQSKIAAPLGRALEVSVGTDATSNSIATTNAEAHDHYLQGLHALDTYSRTGTETAANEFQAAIALDPTFAAAYVSLAMAYYVQSAFGFVSPDIGFPRVRQEALRGLSLNPKSAIAHALLARVATLYSWNWVEAHRESQAALALGAQNSFVLYAAADLAAILGDFDQSERLFRASLVSDPLNPEVHFMLALVLLAEGRAQEAEAEARRCLTINPTYAYAHYALAFTLLWQDNDGEESLAECKLETAEGGQLNCLAMAYAKLGRLQDSDAALNQSIETRGGSAAFGVARVLAYRGQHERAFEWLNRAYEQRDPIMAYIKGDPNIGRLSGDPRYKALLQKLKLETVTPPE